MKPPRLFLNTNGSISGPHEWEEIERDLNKGRLHPATPARIEGLDTWQTVGIVLLAAKDLPAGGSDHSPDGARLTACVLTSISAVLLLSASYVSGMGINRALKSLGVDAPPVGFYFPLIMTLLLLLAAWLTLSRPVAASWLILPPLLTLLILTMAGQSGGTAIVAMPALAAWFICTRSGKSTR